MLAGVEEIVRDRNKAENEAARLARENGDLCDRVAELQRALEWFADEGHYQGSYRRGAGYADAVGKTKARAALLGMDEDDAGAVDTAWAKRAGRRAA